MVYITMRTVTEHGLMVYKVYVNGTHMNTFLSREQAMTKVMLYRDRLNKSTDTLAI